MQEIHFFRPGRHTSNNGTELAFSAADLKAIADAYDPRTHEAPIVVGHPKTDAPAYGWVEKIIAKPDGLYAVPRQVNPEFSDLVRQGSYKKVSGSFYTPEARNHPKPGTYYLRHLGFLGAQPPAVKGLRSIELSEDDEGIVNLEDAFADLREHRLNERERAIGRQERHDEIRRLNREGRIAIGHVEPLLAFVDSLRSDEVVNFSEDDGGPKPQAEWFMEFLRTIPVPVVLGELATGEDFSDMREVEVPEGGQIDRGGSSVLHAHALNYMKDHPGTSYADAVRAVDKSMRSPTGMKGY